MFLSQRIRAPRWAVLMMSTIVILAVLVAGAPRAESASDCSAGWVALTYDDGPIPTRTSAVLAALDSAGVPATFFTVGYLVRAYPGTVRDAAARGHAIANHTDQHQNLTTLSETGIVQTLNATDSAIRNAGVDSLRLVRPPYGYTNSFVKSVIQGAGYTQILWDVDPQDWSGASAYSIWLNVVNNAKDGSVILLHDGNANYSNTASATKSIVATLKDRGYCFGVLDGFGRVVERDVGVDEWEEVVQSEPEFVSVVPSSDGVAAPGDDVVAPSDDVVEWEVVVPSVP